MITGDHKDTAAAIAKKSVYLPMEKFLQVLNWINSLMQNLKEWWKMFRFMPEFFQNRKLEL